MSTLTAPKTATQCRAANRMTCRHHGQPLVVNSLMRTIEDSHGDNVFRGELGVRRLRQLESLVEMVSRYPNASRDVFTVRHEMRQRMHEFNTLDSMESVDQLVDDIAYMQVPNAEEQESGLPHRRGTALASTKPKLSMTQFFNID